VIDSKLGIWRGLRVLFLLRVPIATLLVLAALGPLARGPLQSLLGNLFDQSGYRLFGFRGGGTFLVSLGSFLLAYAAVTGLNLILYYGSDRFPDAHSFRLRQKRPVLAFCAGTAAATVLVVCVILRTEEKAPAHLIGAVLGFALALGLVLLAKTLQLAVTDPCNTPSPPPYLVFPAYRIPKLGQFFINLYRRPNSSRLADRKKRLNRWNQWLFEILRPCGQGLLVDISAPAGTLRLRSGHVFALSLAAIALAGYTLVGIDKRFITAAPVQIPALAFVLLCFNLICWSLGALTFFFDRYRFPLLWTVGVLAALTASAPQSDHFFRVETLAERRLFLTPPEYLRKRIDAAAASGEKLNLIFVATPGGGIQAAAWTARVLTGLNELSTNDRFKNSVAFISSVSGGSLGSLIYTASFPGAANAPIPDPVANSMTSAIDEVAWGWTQPDLGRAVAPWFGRRTVDRGWALEEKWIAVNHLGVERLDAWQRLLAGPHRPDILLSDWAAREAALPALVFNSMLVESGKHVVFSTTRFPADGDPRGIVNFYQLFPKRQVDVRVATAARLSASFPYVAPASRPEIDPYAPGFHFVDGGYYDNYGIDSLIGWLDEALGPGDVNGRVGDILILQIRHFDPSVAPPASRQGWGYQTYAPISGLLAMWNAAPASRDRNELVSYLKTIGQKRKIWQATVQFEAAPGTCAPLSWKLSGAEQKCITETWDRLKARDQGVKCVSEYLNRQRDYDPQIDHEAGHECAQ
jgi:hypothetical protein